jgi:serine/threonine protein kinase/Tol biopolymer transport system component
MGVVFRARDTKLLRDVALKVLPEHFADDPDRLQRLNREAQVLAALNHPNIAQIYGLEQVGSAGCIVMELVEGETLGERLQSGPLPVDEAIAIAKQIADGLAAAHERGIVHRDLKPANIKLTPSGVVKILDFGLAKAMAAPEMQSNPSMLPTKVSGSVVGAIVGTAAYMSPEQARGKEVDARTDIWAFGCVLYETLTAKQAFEGETITDMLAKIVTGQPDFTALPAGVSSSIRLLLETTLTKSVSQRLQHIGDVRLFLDPKFFPTAAATAPAEKRRSLLPAAVLAVLLLAALVPAALYFRSPPTPVAPLMRFELTPPGLGSSVVVSPDGLRIAYSALSGESNRSMWVRPIGSDVAQKLPGTDNPVAGGLWSPDGRYIAFVADGKLKKVDVSSGSVQVICTYSPPFGGMDWNRDGTIIFGRSGTTKVIARVSSDGGAVTEVTALDASRKETFHAVPAFLPDGKHFLFAAVSSIPENTGLYISSLDDPKMKSRVNIAPLPNGLSNIGYVAPGYLIMQSGAAVIAQPFDANKFTLSGKPVTVVDGMEPNSASFSNTGLMFYEKASANAADKQLVWFDRAGRELGKVGAPANYGSVELSPNGDRAAVDMISNKNRDIWVLDIARGVPARISYDPGSDWSPSWSGDGSKILWASNRSGNDDIYSRAASGVGAEELVYPSDKVEIPVAWSRDGKYIAFSRLRSNNAGTDMWVLQMPEKKESLFVESPFEKIHARISPDGHWITYASNDTGTYQIVVQSFPDPNVGKWQITAQGGVEPKWRRDGKELYYLAFDGKLMAVPVKTDRTFEAGTPVALFDTGLTVNKARADRDRRYDVAPDGRFLIVMPVQSGLAPVTAVVNWTSGLEK